MLRFIPIISFIIVLLAQLALALLPLLTSVRLFIAAMTEDLGGLPSLMVTLVSIHAALLTVLLGTGYKAIQSISNSTHEAVEIATRPLARIVPLAERGFYADFEAAWKKADSRVWACYLGPHAPIDKAPRERIDYYKRLRKRVIDQKSVHYRRLIRDTPENRKWAIKHAEQLQGQARADVALLSDSGLAELPLALSVQIIDDKDTWLVAIDSHDQTGVNRDVHVNSADFNMMMARYYDRLWKKADLLLDRGTLTTLGTEIKALSNE